MEKKAHDQFMQLAISLSKKAPAKSSNFSVGAVLVNDDTGVVISTGYTLELSGNTHAEECCLAKLKVEGADTEESDLLSIPSNCTLYSTMEPCNRRLSGKMPCVDRIIEAFSGSQGAKQVYVGVMEPKKFVDENKGAARLEERGIRCIHLPGYEAEILGIATAGHNAE